LSVIQGQEKLERAFYIDSNRSKKRKTKNDPLEDRKRKGTRDFIIA